jgi:hypothetical protein
MSGVAVVRALTFTSRRETVYNLAVAGSPTYLVGGDGVWVHNCEFRPKKWRYSSRVGPGGNPRDPWGPNHNYPTSFDRSVFREGTITEMPDGYLVYELEGRLNNSAGGYQIGGYLADDGVFEVVHRFFKPSNK